MGTPMFCTHLLTLRMMKSTLSTLNLGLRWICPTPLKKSQRISHKLKKSSAAQKCTNFGQLGHNKRGCKVPPKSNDASEGQIEQR